MIPKYVTLFLTIIAFVSCHQNLSDFSDQWTSEDELAMIELATTNELGYKVINSKVLDKLALWKSIDIQIENFDESEYESLYPLIYEQDIYSIQKSISNGALTYEGLTKWYLFRILKFEQDPGSNLNGIISISKTAVAEAKKRDKEKSPHGHAIYGMPILLKDNINTEDLPTTAGALALNNSKTKDAFIVTQLKNKGAIILGKANLSEWAYFFCSNCPSGYSAMGGQTLNPYGRGKYGTGGSSSGSAVVISANYAVGAVGSETSGSILSPSSKNSIVGLKPTVGTLSRSGIVPISSKLDTPGPMTKSVHDNIILYDAMYGEDKKDIHTASIKRTFDANQIKTIKDFGNMTFGVFENFEESSSLYAEAAEVFPKNRGKIVRKKLERIALEGFSEILAGEMFFDLEKYLGDNNYPRTHNYHGVKDIVNFNLKDSVLRSPYGQSRLLSAASNTMTRQDLEEKVITLKETCVKYFDAFFKEEQVDIVLSIDNYSAGYAAMAHYPCLTIPMGFDQDGTPKNLTFIGRSGEEMRLYEVGLLFEKVTRHRRAPF